MRRIIAVLLNCFIATSPNPSFLRRGTKGVVNNVTIKQCNNRFSRGFTLIELIVVIAVIGILATFVVTNVSSALKRAKDSERINSLKQIQTALELYYQDNGAYPDTNWKNSIPGGRWLPELTEKYIKEMPVDPKNSGCSSSIVDPRHEEDCYAIGYMSWNYCNVKGQGYILDIRLEATDTTEFSQKTLIDPSTGSPCSGTTAADATICPDESKAKWSQCPIEGLYVLVNP